MPARTFSKGGLAVPIKKQQLGHVSKSVGKEHKFGFMYHSNFVRERVRLGSRGLNFPV